MRLFLLTVFLLFSSFLLQSWTNCFYRNSTFNSKKDPSPMIFAEFFSPNGDDVNDFFVIKNVEEYPINKMHIFNRWGDLVYTSEPYKNEWNGISNAKNQFFGTKVPDGIYFFKFEYLIGDFQENRNGKVILMR